MPDNDIGWGQGAVNNDIGWGKAQSNNTIGFGAIYENSPSGDTNLIGGTPTPPVPEGIANNFSMEFDGSDDYIDVGMSLGNTLGGTVSDMTVSLWYKNQAGSNIGLFSIMSSITASNTIPFAISYNNNSIYVWFGSNYNSYAQTLDTNWHHLSIVKNGTSLTTYIDGSSVSPSATVGSIPITINTTNRKTFIGVYYNSGFTYNGSIDEVAVWNTALTATQIQSIYNATGTNLTKDLTTVSGSNLVYWNRMGD